MPLKPQRNAEDEYFVREDALKKQKLALDQARRQIEEHKRQLKKIHWMHCPKCGMDLRPVTFRGVEIDRCENCGGVWLDSGDLEKLAAREKKQKGAVVRSILNIFNEPVGPTGGTQEKAKR